MTESQVLKLDEAAQYLRVSPRVVRNLISNGELWGRKVGGSWRVRRIDVEGLLSPSSSQSTVASAGA
jgi:excisionase family DNA binding protein